MTKVAKTSESQGRRKKKNKGVKDKLKKQKFKTEEEKIISRLDRLKNEIDGIKSEDFTTNLSDDKVKTNTEHRLAEIIEKEKTKKKKKKKKNKEIERQEVPEIEIIEIIEIKKKEGNDKENNVKVKKKKKKKEGKQQNDKLVENKSTKEQERKMVKLKIKGTKKKEEKPIAIKENKKCKKLVNEKMKEKKPTEKKKKKKKDKKSKNQTNAENNPLEDVTVKAEFPDADLELKSNSDFLNNLDVNFKYPDDDVKSEPPDPDDVHGFSPEGFGKSNPGDTAPYMGLYLEPGEATIKTEPDVVLCDDEIKKECLDNKKDEKKEFLICFRNLIKGSEEEKIKELSYRVLDPKEIVDLFLVKDRKKRFGFLKVASREALEKVLKIDGWAVDGRIIKVTESNLIQVKKDPPLSKNLNLTPPPEPQKRKLRDLDRDVIEEKVIEKHIDDLLAKVKKGIEIQDDDNLRTNAAIESNDKRKNIRIEDDDEGSLTKRYSAFLGNINFNTTDDQIRTFLESIVAPPKITRLHRSKKRSIAFVDLADKESLERVLKLNDSKLMGRLVRIQIATGKDKKKPYASTDNGSESTFKKFRDFSARPKAKKFKKS